MAIVLVDDSATTLAVLSRVAGEGGEVVTFVDAVAARDYLSVHPARVVVVDYSMPGMTGLELASTLRAQPRHAATPIVMVTAAFGPEIRARARASGVTCLLSKPVNAAVFRALLHNFLNPQAPQTLL